MPTTEDLIKQAEVDLSGMSTADLIKAAESGAAKPAPAANVSWLDALMPSRARAEKENASLPRQMLARAKDVATVLPAAAYAAAETLNPRDPKSARTFKENLADREGGTLVKRIANDPATLPTAAMTGGGSTVAQVAKAGLKQGLVSAGTHQAENVAEGRDISPKGAIAEIVLSTLLPVAAKKGGAYLKEKGKDIINSLVKTKQGIQEQIEKVGAETVADLFFANNVDSPIPFKGSLKGAAERTGGIRADANQKFGQVMDANKGVEIDLLQSAANASKKMGQEFVDEGKHAGVLPGIKKGEEQWLESLAAKGQTGKVPLKFSQGFKQEVGDAGNFLATDPAEVKGAARFANEFYRDIRDQQNQQVPDLIPLNRTLSETKPLKEALEDALVRTGKNNLLTPSDLWTLAPALMAGGAGQMAAGPGAAAAAFAAPLAVNRLSKNPTFASQLYRLGESMENPGPIAEVRKKAIERALATGLFSGNQ